MAAGRHLHIEPRFFFEPLALGAVQIGCSLVEVLDLEAEVMDAAEIGAVGTNIAHYEPWKLGASVDNPKGEVKWDPAAIGAEINAQVFHSRHPGLKMG